MIILPICSTLLCTIYCANCFNTAFNLEHIPMEQDTLILTLQRENPDLGSNLSKDKIKKQQLAQ